MAAAGQLGRHLLLAKGRGTRSNHWRDRESRSSCVPGAAPRRALVVATAIWVGPFFVTPSDLLARAVREVDDLGPSPATGRARVQWREQRGRAAITLAALADWNTALLSQTALLAEGENDGDARVLLREACAWTRP